MNKATNGQAHRTAAAPARLRAHRDARDRGCAEGTNGQAAQRPCSTLDGGPLAALSSRIEPPHRLGRSPAPLLAAAGRARRQGLLLHQKEAPCAHGHASPRPHQSHVHLSPWRRQPQAIATAAAALRARGKGGATRSGAHMGVPIVVKLMRNPTLTTSGGTCGRSSSTAQRG